jgi:hypothetical protein
MRRLAIGSLVVAGALALASCGSGGGGSSAGTVTVLNEVGSTSTITQLDFTFLVVSLLPDRVETVSIAPGASQGFAFSAFEADNAFTLRVHWADTTTTTYPLFGVSGGTTIGVSH